MRNKIIVAAIICFLPLFLWKYGYTEDIWRVQASVETDETGIFEAALPPGLYFDHSASIQEQALDLKLIGPDGKERSFEMYWKEKKAPVHISLNPTQIIMKEGEGIAWEASVPDNILIRAIRVNISNPDLVGKMDIEALSDEGWQLLSKDAAIYQDGESGRVEFRIEPQKYKQIRLNLSGYDEHYKKRPLMIHSVEVDGDGIGKDYAETVIDLTVEQEERNGEWIAKAVLPGSGLWISDLTYRTDAQFQGLWKIGSEEILSGYLEFRERISGINQTVGKDRLAIQVPINTYWPGRSMVLKLNSQGRFFGEISQLKIRVRVPRIVFLAEKPGTYTLQSGSGRQVSVLNYPGDPERHIDQVGVFSDIQENMAWHPEVLVEQYNILGGPFNPKGYEWRAPISIPEPGYYRLKVTRFASLSPNASGVRLVRDMTQIPYFTDKSEQTEINLETTLNYNKDKNSTEWFATLPIASSNWVKLRLYSNGIFDREVLIEKRNPVNLGWEQMDLKRWRNSGNGETTLDINLNLFPADQTEIRIMINHGENSPVAINRITATYPAPVLLFLAGIAGEYELMGGNPEAGPALYDLSLVKSHLLGFVPQKVEMGEVEPLHTTVMDNQLVKNVFTKQTGLYGILGLVTLFLVVIIVKLFPKNGNPVNKKE